MAFADDPDRSGAAAGSCYRRLIPHGGAAVPTLVGRSSELASLVELLPRAAEGPCQVALIEGEAGIGKTRLLAEVLDHARARGFRLFVGAAAELERDRPFGALAEALGLRPTAPDPERAEIGLLLAGDGEAIPGSMQIAEAPGLRFQVLEAVLTMVERLCLSAPTVIALEDLHWADPSTLLAVRQLRRRLAHLPLALFGPSGPRPPARSSTGCWEVSWPKEVPTSSSGAWAQMRSPPWPGKS